MDGFVLSLPHELGQRQGSRHHPKRKPTQFFLKQSWEQKKLSFMPNFKQVGHCKASASLSQSTPRHFLLGGSSDVTSLMVECSGQVDGGEGRKWIALLPFCWSEAVPAHRRVRLSQNQPRPAARDSYPAKTAFCGVS